MKKILLTIITTLSTISIYAENMSYSENQPLYFNLNTGIGTGYTFTNPGNDGNQKSGAPSNNYSLGANIGYKFNEYVAAEIGYNHLWLAKTYANTGGQVGVEDIAARGTLPLGDIFSLYGRLGVGGYQNMGGSDNSGTNFAHNIGVLYGAGAQWALSRNLALRLEDWSVTGFGQNIIQAGVEFSF
ncbi:MAG: outer membrane beta-barrel protein [Neisseriaceae bacterium]